MSIYLAGSHYPETQNRPTHLLSCHINFYIVCKFILRLKLFLHRSYPVFQDCFMPHVFSKFAGRRLLDEEFIMKLYCSWIQLFICFEHVLKQPSIGALAYYRLLNSCFGPFGIGGHIC